MLPIVRDLLQLQDCDQRIRSLSKDLKDIPRLETNAQLRLEGDQQAVATAQNHIREIELKIKAVELDIQTRQTSIQRLKDQQFATRKNEEFRALGHEVERYEAEVSKLEDQQLELMEQLDSIKPSLLTAQQALANTQGLVDDELNSLKERAEAIRNRLDELNQQRTTLSSPIDESTLSLYNRLMKSKGDVAIAPMSDGICGGCHVRVISGTIQSLKASQNITQCEQCGRILYQF